MTSTPHSDGTDDLAQKIAALKAELAAEQQGKGGQASQQPVEPSAVINPGTDAPMASAPGNAEVGQDSTLAELSRQIRESVADVPDTLSDKTFRVVVATDWSSATVPLAVLQAYSGMFAPDAPVELVFAVPHEPTSADLEPVKVLFEGLEGVEDTAPLQIEGFDEVTSKACYAVIVPSGDPDALIMEIAVFFTQLHQLAAMVSDPAKLTQEPAPAQGFNEGLNRRLSQFSGAGRA